MGACHDASDAQRSRSVPPSSIARLDGRQNKGVYSWPRVEAEPRVDFCGNAYVERNDQRLEIRCEVERPLTRPISPVVTRRLRG
jgi:hypothetical protein